MTKVVLAAVLLFSFPALAQQPGMSFFISSTGSGKGAAMVGHHDRIGLRDDDASRSWNSSHASRGCSDPALQSSGGAGLIYCFAAK